MPIDPKKLFEKAAKSPEPERGPVSIYLDKALFRGFQQFCKDRNTAASRILEEFMREAMAEKDGAKRK